MVIYVRRVRKVGVVLACTVCIVIGLWLVQRFVTTEAVGQMRTVELLAVLGLLVLPAATVCAFELESRSRRLPPVSADAPATGIEGHPDAPTARGRGAHAGSFGAERAEATVQPGDGRDEEAVARRAERHRRRRSAEAAGMPTRAGE